MATVPVNRLDDFDGFWVDEELDRTLHVGWEDGETLYIDLFDSWLAAFEAEGNDSLVSILLNVKTGEVKLNTE